MSDTSGDGDTAATSRTNITLSEPLPCGRKRKKLSRTFHGGSKGCADVHRDYPLYMKMLRAPWIIPRGTSAPSWAKSGTTCLQQNWLLGVMMHSGQLQLRRPRTSSEFGTCSFKFGGQFQSKHQHLRQLLLQPLPWHLTKRKIYSRHRPI